MKFSVLFGFVIITSILKCNGTGRTALSRLLNPQTCPRELLQSELQKCCIPSEIQYYPSFRLVDPDAAWKEIAMAKLWAERDKINSPLIGPIQVPFAPEIDLYFKDESKTPTGSLKHRFGWALVMWGIVDGKINSKTHVVEASSGNTAASVSYFVSGILGLEFTAFMSTAISPMKVKAVQKYGGKTQQFSAEVRQNLEKFVASCSHCFHINQHGNSERALDYFEASGNHKSMNLLQEALEEMKVSPHTRYLVPSWYVSGVGTGGTITSVGKFAMRNELNTKTKVAVVDGYNSLIYEYVTGDIPHGQYSCSKKDRPKFVYIEGVGDNGPMVFGKLTSFLKEIISAAIRAPDPFIIASMHKTKEITGVASGVSTGLNLYGMIELAWQMKAQGQRGSILSIICDGADRYQSSYYNATFIEEKFRNSQKSGWDYINCATHLLHDAWYGVRNVSLTQLGDCNFARDRVAMHDAETQYARRNSE